MSSRLTNQRERPSLGRVHSMREALQPDRAVHRVALLALLDFAIDIEVAGAPAWRKSTPANLAREPAAEPGAEADAGGRNDPCGFPMGTPAPGPLALAATPRAKRLEQKRKYR